LASSSPALASLHNAAVQQGLVAQLGDAGEPWLMEAKTLGGWLELGDGDPDRAMKAMQVHLEWRRKVVGSGSVAPSQIPKQLAAEKAFLQPSNSEGKPLVVVLAKNHFADDMLEYLRLLAFTIDGALAAVDLKSNPGRKLYAAVDLQGIGLRNLDAGTLKALFDVIALQYPGHLELFWFVNAPMIFSGLWRVVNPVIHRTVRDKVQFVRLKNGVCSEMLEQVGPDSLPLRWGGTAPLVPVEIAVMERRSGSVPCGNRSASGGPLSAAQPMQIAATGSYGIGAGTSSLVLCLMFMAALGSLLYLLLTQPLAELGRSLDPLLGGA